MSLASLGGLLDRRPWAVPLELGRVGLAPLAAAALPLSAPAALLPGAVAAASALWLLRSRKGALPLPAVLR